MTNEPTGGQRRDLSVPPALLQAVEVAVGKEVRPLMDELAVIITESKAVLEQLKSDDGLTNMQLREELKRCKQKLQYAENRIADLEQSVIVYRENANRRGKDIAVLEQKLSELTYEISALRSVIDNRGGAVA